MVLGTMPRLGAWSLRYSRRVVISCEHWTCLVQAENADAPSAYGRRPLDLAAFAIEPSPNADVSQEDRTRAVVALIDEVTREDGDKPVVLVGHSLGGLTVTAVAEESRNASAPWCTSQPCSCRPEWLRVP